MAGIGFALDRLYRSDSIVDRMASFAHASVIAAGPCLLSVLCIWLIGSFNSELEGRSTITALRALVIYSFALSFVVTAPFGLVSARRVSDKLHDRDVAAVPGIMLACLVVGAGVTVSLAVVLFGGLLVLDPPVVMAAVVDSVLVALIWLG